MLCSELAENIMTTFKEKQKQKYGDQTVWRLIEPSVKNNNTIYDSSYSNQEIKNLYDNIVKKPSKYPHMNEWASESMHLFDESKYENIQYSCWCRCGFFSTRL